MNLPFYIAKRYLISKKSHNIINIISGISVAGITIGALALIVILSVFNGFEKLITSLYNSFYPDLLIESAEGKTINLDNFPTNDLEKLEGIIRYTEVIEENVLLRQDDKQHIAYVKGVSESFLSKDNIDSTLVEGSFVLERNGISFAVLGVGVAYYLDTRISDFPRPISIFAARKSSGYSLNMSTDFNQMQIMPSGIFSVQHEVDAKYILVPLKFAKELLDYTNEISAVEIGIDKDLDVEIIQEKIKAMLGDNYTVQNRFEQQALLYKIMKSEKLAIFLILTFILIIATFNIIGSLSMLILDKKKDIVVLQSMGADAQLIRRIFLIEGSMISIIGALGGLVLGSIICFLQQQYGIIKLGNGNGSFVVDSYPVLMQMNDFILIFLTVSIIGIVAAWIPVRQISNKYLKVKLT